MKLSLIISALGTALSIAAAFFFIEDKAVAAFIALVLVAMEGGMYLLFFRPFFQSADLVQTGQPAEATVLKMWDTGWTINENPQVGLRLEVRPAGDPPYEAETKMVISRLMVGQIRPGSVLKVRYDPKNPQRVVWDAGAKVVVSPRALARMAELEELQRQGLVSEEEYERKRREILGGV